MSSPHINWFGLPHSIATISGGNTQALQHRLPLTKAELVTAIVECLINQQKLNNKTLIGHRYMQTNQPLDHKADHIFKGI